MQGLERSIDWYLAAQQDTDGPAGDLPIRLALRPHIAARLTKPAPLEVNGR
jgi:hypothetical protein